MDKEVQELVTELINYDNKEDLSWLQVLKNLLKERNLEYNDEILKKVTKEITKAGYEHYNQTIQVRKIQIDLRTNLRSLFYLYSTFK